MIIRKRCNTAAAIRLAALRTFTIHRIQSYTTTESDPHAARPAPSHARGDRVDVQLHLPVEDPTVQQSSHKSLFPRASNYDAISNYTAHQPCPPTQEPLHSPQTASTRARATSAGNRPAKTASYGTISTSIPHRYALRELRREAPTLDVDVQVLPREVLRDLAQLFSQSALPPQ